MTFPSAAVLIGQILTTCPKNVAVLHQFHCPSEPRARIRGREGPMLNDKHALLC